MAGIEDDYELLPRQEVENLRKEIDKLKKNPIGTTKQGEDLLEAVNALNSNISKLIDIFTNAEAELAKEYAESNPVDDLKNIREQNEQIAQGLLTVADMVKDLKEQNPNVPQPNFGAHSAAEDPGGMPEEGSFELHEPLNRRMINDKPQPPQNIPNQSQFFPGQEPSLNPAPQAPPGMQQPNTKREHYAQQPKKGLFSRK